MSTPESQSPPSASVLLLGNPNVGKTTLFNRLCGLRSATSNFPGSTVEARIGKSSKGFTNRSFTDLPGTYSLNTPDDLSEVCRHALDGVDCDSPDTVLIVADATNLRRNLTLVNEVLHHNVPCVVVLSMVDIAQKSGLTIDTTKFGAHLGCHVVSVHPRTGEGINDLHQALDSPKIVKVQLPQVDNHAEVNAWANETIASSVGGTLSTGTLTDRLDAAFTHPILGLMVFAAIHGWIVLDNLYTRSIPNGFGRCDFWSCWQCCWQHASRRRFAKHGGRWRDQWCCRHSCFFTANLFIVFLD